jgi:NADPH-dependent 2,4-dienoyl-CoA reductase/sulfur reductase-like enzyme
MTQSGHPLGSLKAYEVPYAASAACLSISDFQSGADFTFASSMTRTVLISGGGIAGPTMAFWLKAAGFQPTLVEQAPAPRRGGYVIDFWGLGYDIAERMGLIEEINRAGYHIRDMRIVDAKGKRISGFGTSVFLELTGGRYVTVGRPFAAAIEKGEPRHRDDL